MEIEASGNKPYVKLDKENCTLTIRGRSYPEHPAIFYDPIVEELIKCSDYMEGEIITINLALEIMNSVSTKYIYNIINSINKSSKELNINWYYEEDDEDMKEEGYLFKNSFKKANFKLISVMDLIEL
tara:strand:- start:1212 stop:1592 length:381 start_codon:yes stop_codon:yes gene_type:complete